MKTSLITFKRLTALAVFSVIATFSFAQSQPLVISNSTGCTYKVEIKAADEGNCNNKCVSIDSPVCVGPNDVVFVDPCGNADYYYAVVVTPMDDDCRNICGTAASVASLPVSQCWTNLSAGTGGGEHCDCGDFTARFDTDFELVIE